MRTKLTVLDNKATHCLENSRKTDIGFTQKIRIFNIINFSRYHLLGHFYKFIYSYFYKFYKSQVKERIYFVLTYQENSKTCKELPQVKKYKEISPMV